MDGESEINGRWQAIRAIALDPEIIAVRLSLACFTADLFRDVGTMLHVFGHVLGPDRKSGVSPFGHGDDGTVAVSMLLRIGSQLVSGSADLIETGRYYAGSALVRQLVEVEYLAWAFETRNEEAARWLRSSRQERQTFFTPAKLRESADGRFRSVDYWRHCELGGHPVPTSWRLLTEDATMAQLMLSDCLVHASRIWNHILGWAKSYSLADILISKAGEVETKFMEWKKVDALVALAWPPAKCPDV